MIKVAVTFLRSKGYSNFFITGSVALIKNFGIPLGREPKDIDIILLGDTTNEEDDKILFKLDGILVNVFIQKEINFKKSKLIDNVRFIDDIQQIINEKLKMSRDKDLEDIEIINKFLTEKKLQ
nr:MAG TPA: hypothetical protein [Caudoviricetes sp.]